MFFKDDRMKILYRLYYFVRKLLFPGGFAFLVSLSLNGQNLCNSDQAIPNGFSIDGPASGCGPFAVKLMDNTGFSDVKYIYTYNGESASELSGLGPLENTQYTYFSEDENTTYTILQYGKDNNGDNFYSCKNVTVRVGVKPRYSYTQCTRDKGIELVIPKHEDNEEYTSFEIKLSNTAYTKTIASSDLPYVEAIQINYPDLLTVTGLINGNSDNCSNSSEPLQHPDVVATQTGIDIPFDINIDTIRLLEPNRVRLNISGSLHPSGYTLQMREAYSDYPNQPFKENFIPNVPVEFELPDPSKSFCFKLSRPIGCGSFEFSPEVCTTPIVNSSINQNGKINLKWVNHPEAKNILPQSIQQKKQLSISEINKGITSKDIPNNTDSLSDFISCGTRKVCYTLTNYINGRFIDYNYNSVSISNEVCLSVDSIKAPAISDIISSTENETISIQFNSIADWPNAIEKFYLYDYAPDSLMLVDSSTSNFFNRPWVDTGEIQCFQVGYIDDCGIQAEPSERTCIVYLRDSLSKILNWTPESPFVGSEIDRYEVLAQNETTGTFESIYQANIPSPFSPDLENFEDKAMFKIVAYSANGGISYSNLVSLPLRFDLFIPNSFSPNTDGVNDFFLLFGDLEKITSFSISIIDRLGREVYRSDSPSFQWSPEQREEIPSGVYNYFISLENTEQEQLNFNGHLHLLR